MIWHISLVIGSLNLVSLGLSALIIGFIGLNYVAKLHYHPSLIVLLWVLVAIFLMIVLVCFVGMMYGTFGPQGAKILDKEVDIMDKWLQNSKGAEMGEQLEHQAAADEEWSWQIDKIKSYTEKVRRSSGHGMGGRIASILVVALIYSLMLAVIFEICYADWMLGIVTENLGGIPYHKALGIVYFVSDFACALF